MITSGRERRLSQISSGRLSASGLVGSSHFSHADYGDYFFSVDSHSFRFAAKIVSEETTADGSTETMLQVVGQPAEAIFSQWSFPDDGSLFRETPQSDTQASTTTLQSTNNGWNRRRLNDDISFEQWSDCDDMSLNCTLSDVFFVDPDSSSVSYNDFDGDNIVDEIDTDDDNDRQSDEFEAICGSDPKDASSVSKDTDADKEPNCIDDDDDNDNVPDENDDFPLDSSESVDSDSDGLGDNIETSVGLDPQNPNDVTGSPREILWRNSVSGKNTLWSMESQYWVERNAINDVADLNWQVEGMADFTGDGMDEILFRHQTRGENRLWTIEDGVRSGSIAIQGAHPNWFVAAIGDFDSDGDADLIWRNSVTGENRYWEMDGQTRIASLAVRSVALNWIVAGSGDFDGDGRSDLLWRDTNTGANIVWLLQGATIKERGNLLTVHTSWQVAGTGDFDADGLDDIMWRNKDSGANSIWLLSGASLKSRASTTMADTVWVPFGIIEMNGDGMADILWRNSSTGANRLWLMNGTTRTDSLAVHPIGDQTWDAVAVGNVQN